MLGKICIVALVACATAQIFHLGGNHHDHAELGSFSFFYDPKSHYLIGRTSHNCYFMSLGPTEQHDIHTNTGLETSELKMITMIGGGEDELTSDQMLQHSRIIDLMCNHHTLYMVGPVSTVVPTTVV
ncbi:uncharacterized protein LOC132552008 [Ylistrum balloti]|uniref:uncharacterized protein LOC132552008 n=1 Tax=Ylistrum balloti TaxID=509963 RepID=UPI002905977C|nr:uncharacterized protein LOC132552008 [Ylistrum balloti]